MTDALRRLGRGAAVLERAVARPVDIAWLAALRIAFGASMCVSMLRFIGYGWIDPLFVEPKFRFKYWGFGWVEALPPAGMHALFWVLAGLALAVMLGFRFRLASALFTLGFAYLELVDVTNYLNHYYLAALISLLLTLSPAHRAWSLDALLDPAGKRETVSTFWLYLLRFQVGVVYFFAGMAKAHADWLVHAQPLRIWLAGKTDVPALGELFAQPWAPLAMSWAGFLFDATIVVWLSWRPTRPFAYVAVLVFHALTGLLFPIGMFPVIMSLSALVFFEPNWPRRVVAAGARLLSVLGVRSAREPVVAAGVVEPSLDSSRLRRLGLALAGVFVVFELAMPLRFALYGGNVRWHEQGMRFSWRVMVREKNGSVTFVVRDKQSGRTWQVSPARYLTENQEREMSGQPDLILELAHHVRDDFERRVGGPVEVRVDALVSLNGRRLAPLIDPSVDLAQVSDGLARARWILPAPSDPPPHLKSI
jgi:vitamin K-dependent gamma-carboxylase